MLAKIEGEVLGCGHTLFEGKEYPYFELLQRNTIRSEIVRVSGQGFTEKDYGKRVSVDVVISLTDNGKIRVKKIEVLK